MTIRVRFAPSPTGFLHVGGLRTALYNWLFARKHGGVFILRIEDTDQSRRKEGAVENLLAALEWAGLDIDEGPTVGGEHGPYVQSERLETYHQHVRQLLDEGHAYRCFCTPERLEQLREQQRRMGIASRYDRHCRNLPPGDAEARAAEETHIVRLAVPESGRIIVKDIVRKKAAFDLATVDDQVLLKGDGFPTYHLANVVDDHLMQVTHVIRGEEWLPSMPKHLLLYRAFGWDEPIFAHLPLLLNQDRSKLSKRQGHVAVEEYRDQGILPQALVNFIALLGWHDQSDQDVFGVDELIQAFSLERVQKGGAIFDTGKLQWINGQHYRRMNPLVFHKKLTSFETHHSSSYDPETWDITPTISGSVQPRIRSFSEADPLIEFLFMDPVVYDDKAKEALIGAEADGILSMLLSRLDKTSEITGEQFLAIVKEIGQEFGLKGRELWHPIRVALDGKVEGIDIIAIVETLGLEKCRARIRAARAAT